MEHACDSCNAAGACALGSSSCVGCCNARGMAPLGDPEKAALRAWLQEKRQDRNCNRAVDRMLASDSVAAAAGSACGLARE